jgi:hypothetical protein
MKNIPFLMPVELLLLQTSKGREFAQIDIRDSRWVIAPVVEWIRLSPLREMAISDAHALVHAARASRSGFELAFSRPLFG